MDDILGEDLLGYDDGMHGDEYGAMHGDVLGADIVGAVLRQLQARRRAAPARSMPARRSMPSAGSQGRTLGAPINGQVPWRQAQLGPGVNAPTEGLYPLPLVPQTNNGVLTPAIGTIVFSAQPQKPFRGERLIATIVKSAGATAVDVQSTNFFVGTDLQQAFSGNISLSIFSNTAVGVRLALSHVMPGA